MREEIVALEYVGRTVREGEPVLMRGLLFIGTFGMLRHFGSRSCSIRTGQDARVGLKLTSNLPERGEMPMSAVARLFRFPTKQHISGTPHGSEFS